MLDLQQTPAEEVDELIRSVLSRQSGEAFMPENTADQVVLKLVKG